MSPVEVVNSMTRNNHMKVTLSNNGSNDFFTFSIKGYKRMRY